MKVKIKLTVNQFRTLVNWVLWSNVYITQTGVTELQILNIQIFLKLAAKKLIDVGNIDIYNPTKLRVFSVDVNQYTSIMALLEHERNELDPLTLAIFITLQNQNKQLLHLN